MKEENVSGVSTPVSNTENMTPAGQTPVATSVPNAAPVLEQQPVLQPVQPAPAAQVATPDSGQVVTPTPVETLMQPVQTPAPTPTTIAQAVPMSSGDGFGTAQVMPSAPAPEMTSVVQTPTNTQQNNLDTYNNTTNVQTSTEATIAPSVPLSDPVGFVSTGQPLKKKRNKGLITAIVVFILTVLAAVTWFVIIPLVKQYLVTPKQVFDNTISTLSKEVTKNIEKLSYDKSTYTLELEVDSNIEIIKDFAGYTYTGKLGIDTTNKLAESGLLIKDKYDTEYSMFYYAKGGKSYQRYSTNDSLLYIGDDTIDWDMLSDENIITTEEATYLVEKFSSMFQESIDESKLTKNSDSSVTVNGETVKATKFTYSIDSDVLISTVRHFAKGILEDDKLFEIIIKIKSSELVAPTENDIDELRDSLEEGLEEIIEEEPSEIPLKDASLDISIYTTGTDSTFAGIEYIYSSNNGDEQKIQYSTLNGNYNVFIYNKSVWNNETSENTFRIDGVKNGNVTNVSIKENDVEVATLKVNDSGVDKSIDYTILLENIEGFEDYNNLTGNITYSTTNGDKNRVDNLSFEIKDGKDYVKVKVKLVTDWTSEVANINTSASTTVSDYELETIKNNFFNEFKNKTPYGTLAGLFETDDSYDDGNVLNDVFYG